MGFCEVLTIIFVVLKLTNVIAWSWCLVFSPILVSLSLYFLILLIWIVKS
jgi:hypothetical protein